MRQCYTGKISVETREKKWSSISSRVVESLACWLLWEWTDGRSWEGLKKNRQALMLHGIWKQSKSRGNSAVTERNEWAVSKSQFKWEAISEGIQMWMSGLLGNRRVSRYKWDICREVTEAAGRRWCGGRQKLLSTNRCVWGAVGRWGQMKDTQARKSCLWS